MLHDLRVFAWGLMYSHPNIKESRIYINWPITIKLYRHQAYLFITFRFRLPGILVLNAYELENDYLAFSAGKA